MLNNAKKIGILNIQYTDNYGAVLVAYSLQETIKKMGFEPKTLNYNPKYSVLDKLKTAFFEMYFNRNFWHSIGYHIRLLIDKTNSEHSLNKTEKKKKFQDFRKSFLCLTDEISRNITKLDDLFDIYVVGSDIVWKPIRLISFEKNVYFLKFVSLEKTKIAYAASVGTDDTHRLITLSKKYKRNIANFDFISLRESLNVPFFSKLTAKKTEHCLDPTLLLSKEDYEKIIPINRISKDTSIYLYTLSDSAEIIDFTNILSQKLTCGVYHSSQYTCDISNSIGINDIDGPLEFLEKIKNAKTVITNSYHGVIFSIIFKKDFYAFPRKYLDVRTLDLLKLLSLSHRFLDDFGAGITHTEPIDYASVNVKLGELKEQSTAFLKNALNFTK